MSPTPKPTPSGVGVRHTDNARMRTEATNAAGRAKDAAGRAITRQQTGRAAQGRVDAIRSQSYEHDNATEDARTERLRKMYQSLEEVQEELRVIVEAVAAQTRLVRAELEATRQTNAQIQKAPRKPR